MKAFNVKMTKKKINTFNKETYFSWFVAKMDVDFNSILTTKPGQEE